MTAKPHYDDVMQRARGYFDYLNHAYLAVHKTKEDLFWATYMATSDDQEGFVRAESAFKEFIADPGKLAETREHLTRVRVTSASAERNALLHGLTGWLAVFEAEMPPGSAELPNQASIDRLFGSLEHAIRRHDPRIDATLAEQSARGLWAAVHGLLMLSAAGRLRAIRLESVRPTIAHLVDCHLAGLEALVAGKAR